MRLKAALVSLLLLCPCAYCYGQLRFVSVGGEGGYSAMRASYRADLDNGFILIPKYGFFRMSDAEDAQESGSTSRYGLEVLYELSDSLQVLAELMWQPQAVGYAAAGYHTGLAWQPFYYFGGLKEPWFTIKAGQDRTRSYVDISGNDLDSPLRQVATNILADMKIDVKKLRLQAAWQKVIKYSSTVPQDVLFSWADIPYMTVVLQGFVEDAHAVRLSYNTKYVTPYAALTRFHYESSPDDYSTALSAGLHIKLWEADFTGGVEVLEPRRNRERETFFSVSLGVPM